MSKPSQVTVAGNAATYGNYYSTNFVGMANVSAGTNSVPVIAHDVNGNTATNTYQVVVPPASASFSYDLNGCLLTDGARTFGWDAKKELVSIIYNTGANAGNHTEFTYNGAGERVKIAELTGTTIGSGTGTSVKQFVYAGGMAEERDASNTVTKRFFAQGEQRISSGTATNYFYTRDHLGSIREMMASDGTTIAARYSYDPYGRATQVSGSISCDFQYAGMYEHATSGLNLTPARAYSPSTGTWISRDPSGEGGGLNLYAYCGGDPINHVDPSGLASSWWVVVFVALKAVLDFLTPSGDPSKGQPPPQTPPGLSQPGRPVNVDPKKDQQGNKDGCSMDGPPGPPLPNPVPVPTLSPARQAAAAEEAEAAEGAAAAEEEAEGLTILLDVDEAIVAVGVIVK